MSVYFYDYLDAGSAAFLASKNQIESLNSAAKVMIEALKSGKNIFWCGNGGSAADSQHLAAELVGRFRINRKALNSIALTTNSSIITAVANDFGYESIFSRQLEALGSDGDVLIAISTSGESPNIITGLQSAKLFGITTILFTGINKSAGSALADIVLHAQSNITAHIQEVHIAFGQSLCGKIEDEFFPRV